MAAIADAKSQREQRAVEQLIRQLPSIGQAWQADRSERAGEPRVPYGDMSVIARHLRHKLPARPTRNHKADTSEFPGFFEALESLFYEDHDHLRELLSVGLIESLQNITASEHGRWSRFEPWLGVRTLKAWSAIVACWEGNQEPLRAVISGSAFLQES